MLICDTHCDTLLRLAKGEKPETLDVTYRSLTTPGNIHVQCMALYVCTGGMEQKPTVVQKELAAFEQCKKLGFHQITKISEALPDVPNAMLTIEGGEAFEGDVEKVDAFAARGVRMAAIIWNNENGLAHPAVSGSREGLTPLGRRIVERMRACHMAVDISHLNERGASEVLDGAVPPLASHSCARALCDHPRNLTDSQLKALYRARGYVGVNFYGRFLREDSIADIDTVVDHMAYMCDLGGEDCVGFGSDFDGIDIYPEGLRNALAVPALLERMRRRGFGEALVEKIAGRNFERYLALIGE